MLMKGTVASIQPLIHKTAGWGPYGDLPERWVVWAVVSGDRVWLRNVQNDGNIDVLPGWGQRAMLVRSFFEHLIGSKIGYSRRYDVSVEPCNSVDECTLPEPYKTSSFSDIYRWFQDNRPEFLENGLEKIRKQHTAKAVAAKKENAKIDKTRTEAERKHLCLCLGLPENASWGRIRRFGGRNIC